MPPGAVKAAQVIDFHTWPAGQEPVPGHNPPDGLCDVWQQIFNAWGLDPEGDADNDGCSNWMESKAGTNPFLPGDCLKIGDTLITTSAVVFFFDAKAGKRYSIVSDNEPNGEFSTVETLLSPESGASYVPEASITNKTLRIAKAPGALKFYRLKTEDIDSNGDGVSDWVKRQLGLDVDSADSDGDGVADFEQLVQQMQAPDEISVVATTPLASEDGPQSGVFEVRRTRSLFDARVNLSYSGTANASTDYSRSPSATMIEFAPGEGALAIHVNPVQDSALEGSESVTVSLSNAVCEGCATQPVIGHPSSATVIINNTTAPSGTGLLGRYHNTANSNLMHGGNLGQAGTYTYVRSGTAGDYTGTITIPYIAPAGTPAVQPGHVVRATFTGGNLNNAAYNHQDYTVITASATGFTLGIAGPSLPANSTNAACQFSIQSFTHPGFVERVDAVVDFDWQRGTPNGVVISPANLPDNFSATWDGYLHPATAGSYTFRLDADDKARVLLDLNDGNGLRQILEHGWDAAATAGEFKESAPVALALPATPAQRYHIRVEHVETEGHASCRLQWRAGADAFVNIPQAQVYTHTQAMNANYSYTRTVATAGAMQGVITVTLNGHGLLVGNPVELAFSSGALFTPANGNFHGSFTVAAVTSANVFEVGIAAAALPAGTNSTGAGFVLGRPNSATTGLFNRCFANPTFTAPPGRVGVDTAVTAQNNGVWGAGSPNPAMDADTFSVSWTGQVQPQYSEDYTFSVLADDGVRLWINGEAQTLRFFAATSNAGTYNYNNDTGELVVTTTALIPAGSFSVGEIARIDPTNNTITAVAFEEHEVIAVDGSSFTVNIGSGRGATGSGTGSINIDVLNKPVADWGSYTANERYTRIPMVAGQRYDIRLDYYENTGSARCHLYWYSPSQSKQVIPAIRLYPSSQPQAPPAKLSSSEAVALLGGEFSHQLQVSNGGSVEVSGLPAWLNFDGNTGLLTGTPPADAKGPVQVIVSSTGPGGSSTSLVHINLIDTGGHLVREQWNGIAGTSISSIPLGSPPDSTETLAALEAGTNVGDNYGARLRGYLTAPVSGNYFFHLAASDAAELWISNDEEPVNLLKRAWVAPGSGPQQWHAQPNQRSAWLRLRAGKRYYLEVLHKAGAGPDHLAVGWRLPAGGDDNGPVEVVPGYALSPYVEPAANAVPGQLYVARMLAQGAAVTSSTGSATLRLSADESSAILKFSHSTLTSPITAQHIHSDPFLSHPDTIIFDIDTPQNPADGVQPDGSYKWTIEPVGTLSVADIREILKQGKAYINVHTVEYPGGEIRGNFTLANGARSFTPPPPPPSWVDDHATNEGGARFLTQATFGASPQDITALKAMTSYDAWIEDQFAKVPSYHLPETIHMRSHNRNAVFDEVIAFNAWWRNSMTAEDQLRQRLAFALLEILVVSADGLLDNRADALSYYYDILLDHAFGNFRDLLEAMTLSPTMGRYLDMLRNDKPNLVTGRIPNENYAREIKQLFSIGLFRMWPDGTLILNSKDEMIDTYGQDEIVGYAHVLTGWDYGYDGPDRTALNAPADWLRQMRETPARHFTGRKWILNNEVLPGLRMAGGAQLDPYATHGSAQINDPAYRALPYQELAAVHDQLFNHPNTGPLICRQLIQRFVTSNPSRDYLYRVVSAFNDNGYGVRGDMKAVIKAILLDFEARDPSFIGKAAFGKQKEPLLRVTNAARAFRRESLSGTYSQGDHSLNNRTITITTTTPHKLNITTGNSVFLDFEESVNPAGVEAPTSTPYTVASVVNATTFTVNATGWVTGTYSQTAGNNFITISIGSHWLPAGGKAFLDFTSGTLNNLAGFDRRAHTALTSLSTNNATAGASFTIAAPDTSARSGSVMMPRLNTGSYGVANSGLPAPQNQRITLNTPTTVDHHLKVGDPVYLNFTATNGTNIIPVDAEYLVESVVDRNTFTVLTYTGTNGVTNQTQNGMYMFPLVEPPRLRSGPVNSRPSTFVLNRTNATLAQTPLDSPTVFNYFMPDYKFPGSIAAQGITTPEFQLTSETNVIRQLNFLRDGILNPNHTLIGSSFNAGSNALVLDYSQWMGNAVDGGLGAGANPSAPWTNDSNLASLIDKLSLLLTAGQLPAAAKSLIHERVLAEKISRPITAIGTGATGNITTLTDHNLSVGSVVAISGITGGTFSGPINATHTVTAVPSATTFRVGVTCTSTSGISYVFSNVATPNSYNNTSPTDMDKRNRLRAIIYLIVTSADFAIQR